MEFFFPLWRTDNQHLTNAFPIISALHQRWLSRRKRRQPSHFWDSRFVLVVLPRLTPTLYPAVRPAVRKTQHWHPDIALSEFFNAGKPPSKIFHNPIISFGFSSPQRQMSASVPELTLSHESCLSPTSTYPHNLLVNMADLFFYVTGTLLPFQKS